MEPVILQTIEVHCSPQTAFDHFTQQDLLETFFCVEAEVEAVVGGKYELAWDPPNKPDSATIGCRITALAEPSLLAFDWKGPPQFEATMNVAEPLTHVVVSFYPLAGDRTRVLIVHSGWRPGEEWQQARDYFDRAWQIVLEALESTIAGEE
ncbi:MAG TPA: SRPBCC domain-containing protein [Anaerolineales bacterium]|jgi:uncharacterized protein YndB with AHSA1/START domain